MANMRRTTRNVKGIQLSEKGAQTLARIEALQRRLPSTISRSGWDQRMGEQYKGVRKLYEALGYPTDEDLTFDYFFSKWDRQDIATAVINRPVQATWSGDLTIVEVGKKEPDSALSKAWKELDKKFKVKKELDRIDKLDGIGRYSLLLFGFSDVKDRKDFQKPSGKLAKLNYIRSISEGNSHILEYETNSTNERFGKPKYYEIELGEPEGSGDAGLTFQLKVHHSRLLHVASGSLVSNVYGRSRLKSIINRLEDLEKLMGGDAETFWRGARPGYHAKTEPDYEMTTTEQANLDEELDKYEHDLRRFISAQGVDIKALEQQVSDPINHVDIQIQAISAETEIPKRILVGSERGELASSQDKAQWLTLIDNRRSNYAEPEIFRAFIDKCMEHGILPKSDYIVVWSDIFAPSEKEKADIGKVRSEALKAYFAEPMAMELIPIELAMKHLMGLNKNQLEEFVLSLSKSTLEEEDSMRGAEEELEDAEVIEDEEDVVSNKMIRTR